MHLQGACRGTPCHLPRRRRRRVGQCEGGGPHVVVLVLENARDLLRLEVKMNRPPGYASRLVAVALAHRRRRVAPKPEEGSSWRISNST